MKPEHPGTTGVPDWAKDAIWYQIFPERFRNGDPRNDPRPEDCFDHPISGWQTAPWGMDWYARMDREKGREFYRTVYGRRFGGDLIGIRSKLDYLQDLGVNAIYLNPIFQAPSLHKYDAACLHHVDPTFGPDRQGDLRLLENAHETENPRTWIWTAADRCLVDLVGEIHRRGMKIILDGVFNHAGTRFFAFQDLLKNGHRSRYVDWIRIRGWKADGTFEYDGWANHAALPEFARTNDDLAEPIREYIFNITRRWMDPDGDGDPADGVDGWRLDVAFCVPHGFWKKWRTHVKRINANAFLTAEIVDLATDYLRGDEFDSVMNYMWLFPAVRFFQPGRHLLSVSGFKRDLNVLRRAYPADVQPILQNLLDSHDVARIATMLHNRLPLKKDWNSYFHLSRVVENGGLDTRQPDAETYQILRQMVIFQMTYPGAPMIYYGTEVGMWGANDPDNRQPMLWEDISHEPETHTPKGRCRGSRRRPDKALFAFFKQAIALRREHKVFRRGAFTWLETGSSRLLGYSRCDSQVKTVVLLNAGDKPLKYKLAGKAVDLWNSGHEIRPGFLTVPPRSWAVLQRL